MSVEDALDAAVELLIIKPLTLAGHPPGESELGKQLILAGVTVIAISFFLGLLTLGVMDLMIEMAIVDSFTAFPIAQYKWQAAGVYVALVVGVTLYKL